MLETQHFAWLPAPAAFDPVTHAVFNEPWRSLTIEGVEGQSAVASVDVQNPQTGLLAPGRNKYAQISLTRDGTVHHLFAGRVVGAPSGLSGDFMTLSLDARFGDIDGAIAAAVAPYKVTPGWDPLFVDPARVNEPMEVLEGYHAHLFVDHRNQAIRVSDALLGSAVSTTAATPGLGDIMIEIPAGLGFAHGVRVRVWYRDDFTEHFSGPIDSYEDGVLIVTADAFAGSTERSNWVVSLDIVADDIDGDSINVSVEHKPYTGVKTVIQAQWTQAATDDVSLTEAIKAASGRPTIRTLSNPEDFANNWPPAGGAINGTSGYTVKTSSLVMQNSIESTGEILVGWSTFEAFGIKTYSPELTVTFALQQKRVEAATFTLTGNAQDVIADLSQVQLQEFSLQDVGPELPSPSHGSFFLTDRGREALNHGMQRTRVTLAESQRCVTTEFATIGWPLEVLYLSCDHSVCVHSPKLPGGLAIGKAAQYSKVMNESGRSCSVTLKCSVGKGYTLATAENDNDYVQTDYIGDGYFSGGGAVVNTGGPAPLAYETFADQAPTDSLVDIATWTSNDFIQSVAIGPQWEAQLDYLIAHAFLGPQAYADNTRPGTPEDTLHSNIPTALAMELASLASQDELDHDFQITMVGAYGLPKTIDLEAA